MKPRIYTLFFAIVSLLIALESFSQKIDSTTKKSFVPNDLKSNGKILLVKIGEFQPKMIQKYEKLFHKNYEGDFQIVPSNIFIDKNYSDLNTYRYVLVINGALTQDDFGEISNTEVFLDKSTGLYTRIGSSLYIWDRLTNHNLYESNIKNLTQGRGGYSSKYTNGPYSWESTTNPYVYMDFGLLKKYVRLLNSN